MRRIFMISSLIICVVFVCQTVMARQQKKALTNADVVAMVKAGLPENTIVLAIQQGPAEVDTSAQALIQLKNQGVGPKVLDAMIQAGRPAEARVQTSLPPRTATNVNPLSPVPGADDSISYGDVVMVDGDKRVQMKRSQVNSRTGGFMMQAVNPFKKTRIQGAINGNHSQLRTTNTSPAFELGLPSDLNPSDYVTLVKLKVKSDRREIEMSRAGITGISSGFRKDDIIPVTREELSSSTDGGRLGLTELRP